MRSAAREALALIAAECSDWIDPDQLQRYMSFLNNHKEVACGLQQARWLRHATTKHTATAGQPILEYCAVRCPHAEQRSPLVRDPPGCDLPSKVLVVGVSPPRSGASWKGVGEPAVGRPDAGLDRLVRALVETRLALPKQAWRVFQYKKALDFYHEYCAFHFQPDAMNYLCTYSPLWWCVGLGTFIHMIKRETAGGPNATSPW